MNDLNVAEGITVAKLFNNVNNIILTPIITLLFAVALLVFFYGIVQFIRSETVDSKREEGKKKIIYGLLGMFIMFSTYGIIKLIMGTFGIAPQGYPFTSSSNENQTMGSIRAPKGLQ